MLLSQLYKNVPEKLKDLDIKGISCNTAKIEEGFAFVCIKGFKTDGHLFAKDAISRGAAVVFVERDLSLDNQIIVEDTHAIFSLLSAKWFNNPEKRMKFIGVTGTNGKTSTTVMIKNILTEAGYKVGLIGTIKNMIGEEVIETERTTPDAFELNSILSRMADAGCDYVVMEVSSHALDQKRVYNISFDVAVFTNLTQDHLDYHKTMDNYLLAKKNLFYMCKTAVINIDDAYAERIINGLQCKIVTVSAKSDESTYTAKGISYKPSGLEYQLVGFNIISRIKLYTGGKFSVYNSLCAAVAALEAGVDIKTACEALSKIEGIKGRAEIVKNDGDAVFVIDYAHTPDGLENILNSFREFDDSKLTVVFGCGGDRDKTKRPIMGQIAERIADKIIVTSDNPRSEDPKQIIDDILAGMSGTKKEMYVIENRVEAIKYAVKSAKANEIVIFAGKGHETYQILKDKTIHLDEREVIAEALSEMREEKI